MDAMLFRSLTPGPIGEAILGGSSHLVSGMRHQAGPIGEARKS